MLRSFLMLTVTVLCVGSIAMMAAQGQPAAKPDKLLRHVVLFQFKESSTPADVKAIEDAFRGLPAKIDAIRDFEWGTDVSVENKSQGFTHCFFVTFRDEKGRDEYLPHPAHQQFVQIVRPHVEKVLVVDYWTQR